jgi:hypothetical protein
MLNTEQFENALYEDGKNAFEKIITKHGNDLYVIGLYHFGGYDGVMPMFNTFSALKEVQERLAGEDSYLIEYTAKWNPSDYPSLEEYSEFFENSEREIRKLSGEFEETIYESDEEIQSRWQQTLRAMERALIRLDKEGVFSTGVDREQITLSISTYDEGEDEQYDRIKRLNPDTVLKRIQSDFETMISSRAEMEEQVMQEALDKILKNTSKES